MNFLNSQKLSRRTVLKGMGAALSLPFLESMYSPAYGNTKDLTAIPPHLAWFYYGNGANVRQFFPKDTGKDFTFSRSLKPFEKYRNKMTVLSGTYLKHGGGHGGDYNFLTSAVGKTPQGVINQRSVDQLAAQQIGQDTRYPSLQFSCFKGTGYGSHMRTLAWNERAIPLAAENDPYVIFNRLFKAESGNEAKAQKTEFKRQGSVLDYIMNQAKKLDKKVSGADQEKLDEYYNSIREVEVQLQRNKAWANKPKPVVKLSEMSDYSKQYTPDLKGFSYEKYSKMMFDLMALAFQTDSTRIITYLVRVEGPGGTYPEFNVSTDYHGLSHHGNISEKLDELARVDTIYMTNFRHLLDRLEAMKMPDNSSLLDHTMLGIGSGMGIGHSKNLLPTVVFGGNGKGIQHQGHLQLPKNTPLASVWHTMIDAAGVQTPQGFQDSKGPIKEMLS